MDNELYSFQVSLWTPGSNDPQSLFERGHWMEYARCTSKFRAEEVALCLSIRHRNGVQVAELVSDADGMRFVGYQFLSEESRTLHETS